jgi:hypothetical protein
MKSAALLFIATAMASGCHFVMDKASIQGSGKSATRVVDMTGFSKIEANGAFDVEIRQGAKSELKVVGDDNLVKLVKFQNQDGVLTAGIDGNYSSKTGLKIIAVMPKVEGLTINGSGNGWLNDVQGDKLEMEINGSGEMKANGKVDNLAVQINGSGDIDASAVESKSASASISGSGSIRVNATNSLNAAVSGSGEVRYKGTPTVSKSVDGSGEIEPM